MNSSLFLSCVADSTRWAILEHLSGQSATVTEIVTATGQTQSNVSHHLKQLRACGFVGYERDGKANRYSIGHPKITEFLGVVRDTVATIAPLCSSEACA